MSDLFDKRPADVLDWDVDFDRQGWLPEGDTIASVDSVTADADAGLVIDDNTFTATAVKVWVSGGTAGMTGTVTVKITTDQGREKQVCFRIRLKEMC